MEQVKGLASRRTRYYNVGVKILRFFAAACICCSALLTAGSRACAAGLGPRKFRAQVVSPTHLVVDANGIPVPLRLAGVTLTPLADSLEHDTFSQEVVDCLQGELARVGGKVRVATSRGYKSSKGETPVVYVYVGSGKGILLNERPIMKGLAYHDEADTKSDSKQKQQLQEAQAAAKSQGLGVWKLSKKAAPKPAPEPAAKPLPALAMVFVPRPEIIEIEIRPDRFYAEKGSKTYYPGSNAWVRKMNPERLLEFKTETEARTAGLKSFASPPKTKTASTKTRVSGKGKLVGLKTDKLVHAPMCPLIKNKPASAKVFLDKLAAAKAVGRTTCRSCIRLGDPNCPQPGAGECMGRMPPYYRPCFRKIETEAGLCKICAGLVE